MLRAQVAESRLPLRCHVSKDLYLKILMSSILKKKNYRLNSLISMFAFAGFYKDQNVHCVDKQKEMFD